MYASHHHNHNLLELFVAVHFAWQRSHEPETALASRFRASACDPADMLQVHQTDRHSAAVHHGGHMNVSRISVSAVVDVLFVSSAREDCN